MSLAVDNGGPSAYSIGEQTQEIAPMISLTTLHFTCDEYRRRSFFSSNALFALFRLKPATNERRKRKRENVKYFS